MNILDDEKDKLLDHEYDGIRELDNHMPVWWLWLFYFTIAFGIGYLAYYQVFGWGPNQHEEYEIEMAAAEEQFNLNKPDEAGTGVAFAFAFSSDAAIIERGKELFMGMGNLCFTCHGNAGEGMVGPNLTDEYWLNGCSPEQIAVSIKEGFPDKGMVAYGSGAPLPDEDVNAIVSFIGSIQGTNPANPKAVDETRATACSE
ncbi:MAG: cbb3-type cytochrome c oxidase N-terminal domain-containing protein [Bacteroidota bacterium]